MDLDWLVFASPDSSYTYDKCNGELIFIPKSEAQSEIQLKDLNNNNNNEKHELKELNNIDINININVNVDKISNNNISENIINGNVDGNVNNPYANNKENKTYFLNNKSSLQADSSAIKTKHIPCLLLRATTSSICPKYALFFHGNAEDINLASEILNHIRFTLSVNVIAPEYPGYGMYPGHPSEEQIFEDSIHVYTYLTKTLKISSNNIIIFGRSLGTSPGTYLASKRDVSALILISPMMSIGSVVRDIVGKLVAYTIKDRFSNITMIEDVKCPILIIHGQNDTLIKYYHSTELYNKAKAPCELILPENMDHNEFDFFQEFSEPLLDFISRNGIFTYTQPCNNKITVELSIVPEEFTKPYKQWNCLTNIFKKFSIS